MRVRTLRAIAGSTLLVIGVILFIVAACVAAGAVASLPDGPVSEGGVRASAAFAIAGAVLFVPAVVLIAWRKPPTVKERHLPTNLSHIVQFPSATDHTDEWQYTYASQQCTMRVTLGDDRAKRLHDDKYKDLLQEETHVLLLLRGEQRLRTALIKMDGDHSRLLYRLTDRPTWESVTLSQVREVRMGQRTRTFEYVGRRFREVSDLSFSIIYGEALASLDIVCNNPSDYVTWTVGLRLAAAFSDNGDPYKLWIKSQWEKLGKTQQDELTVEEVGTIVAMMNLKLRKADHTLQRLFSVRRPRALLALCTKG